MMTNYNKISKDDFLKPENMLLLYARGAFPMADEEGEIDWYLPHVRTIIPLDNYNIPKSLRKFLKKSDFEYRFNFNTLGTIEHCAERENTWISSELIEAYKGLIELGNLHSVEVYQNNHLVGGLYGITYRGAFFGESMFSKVSQASKAALVFLIEKLVKCGFQLLDVQYQTDHLKMFGAVEISYEDFERLLIKSHNQEVKLG